MNRAIRTLIPAGVLILAFISAQAQGQASGRGLGFSAQLYKLRNGLRVVLSEDDSLPLVSVVVAYGAGSLRERPGQSGLAYLMESLMFQGSENVGPLQHIAFVQKIGGDLNAVTTFDQAVFYQTLPSNQLALALWLESDRMKSLLITAGSVEKTREDFVREQARRLSSDPYLESLSRFDQLLFPDFVYGHPFLGNRRELEGLTVDDARAFRRDYYVPNNAVLVIVGSFQATKARELVSRYFDNIPPGVEVPAPPLPRFEQRGETVLRLPEFPVPTPAFHLGYRFYPLQTGDVYAVRILEYILLKGSTARLSARLLKKDRTAYHLSGGLDERLGVQALKVFVMNNNEVMLERSQRAILAEIDKLKTNPLSPDELDKAKNLFKMNLLRRLSTRVARGIYLADAAFLGYPLDSLSSEVEKHLRVNPQNILSLVTRLCVPDNRVIIDLGVR